MTFHARLTELIEKAFRHEGERYADHTDDPLWAKKAAGDVVALTTYLVNHAEAIRDLVMAAEEIRLDLKIASEGGGVNFYASEQYLSEALAKLEES